MTLALLLLADAFLALLAASFSAAAESFLGTAPVSAAVGVVGVVGVLGVMALGDIEGGSDFSGLDSEASGSSSYKRNNIVVIPW